MRSSLNSFGSTRGFESWIRILSDNRVSRTEYGNSLGSK